MRNVYNILNGNPGGKKAHGGSYHTWKDVNWIKLV
jgi:hypothetical protein